MRSGDAFGSRLTTGVAGNSSAVDLGWTGLKQKNPTGAGLVGLRLALIEASSLMRLRRHDNWRVREWFRRPIGPVQRHLTITAKCLVWV